MFTYSLEYGLQRLPLRSLRKSKGLRLTSCGRNTVPCCDSLRSGPVLTLLHPAEMSLRKRFRSISNPRKECKLIRTHILPCRIPIEQADGLNRESGRIYTDVLVWHWRAFRRSEHWMSPYGAQKWSDYRGTAGLHAHSTDAAQEGFYKGCTTTRALKKANIEARFPYRRKFFRTTIWKNTGIRRAGNFLSLSTGSKNPKITILIPDSLKDALRFLEARLVYDKRSQKYNWHLVVEDGRIPKDPPGSNIASVDLGEIHPAVVGDENSATIITCRQRRSESQGHAKRLAKFARSLSKKNKGSLQYKKLCRSKTRMKAKHKLVMRDMEHKISRAIVDEAVARKAGTIVIGDVRDISDGVNCGKKHNQRMSLWNHGKTRNYVNYKSEAEGIKVELQNESYTSQTCPNCGARHKCKGRNYRCPSCKLQAHRDVVGQVNILSKYKHREPGKIPVPTEIKYRIPVKWVMRRCRDTGQVAMPVAEVLL